MMWLAVHDLIRPKWTEQIHDEWMCNVLRDRSDLTLEKLERTRRLMDEHAGECLVSGHETHITSLVLPDPNDRHVLAAAIEAKSDGIITWNLSDFPADIVGQFGIEVQTPDQLVTHLLERNGSAVVAAMREHRASLKDPPKTPSEYLENLVKQGLTKSVEKLMPLLGEL